MASHSMSALDNCSTAKDWTLFYLIVDGHADFVRVSIDWRKMRGGFLGDVGEINVVFNAFMLCQ
jgi:hypothetical protein